MLWLLLSEATSIEIQRNLLKPLLSQPTAEQICFDYYVCVNTEDLDLSAFAGRIWAFVGIWAFAGKDSGFPGEDSVLVGKDSNFGEGFGVS